MGLVALMTRTK